MSASENPPGVPRWLPEQTLLDVIRHIPTPSIDLVVVNTRGEVLLGYRTNEPAKDSWFVPGGRITKDEPLAAAFARIARTELGLELDYHTDARLLGVYEHFYDTNFAGVDGITTHYVVLAHRVDLPEGTDIHPDAQHGEMRWWPVEEMATDPAVHPYTREYGELLRKRG